MGYSVAVTAVGIMELYQVVGDVIPETFNRNEHEDSPPWLPRLKPTPVNAE